VTRPCPRWQVGKGNGARARLAPIAVLLLLLVGTDLAAQLPYDSLPADTLTRDTVNTTERYLKEQAANLIRFPVLPNIGVAGPRVALSRVVLTRDSIEWAMAETVSDLLQQVPGVYLWRGGWLGRTEDPNFEARGATGVEYTLDGLPFVPIGPDSVGVDPSLFSLSLYDRIEIERWPGLLRVHLFTRRHELKAPGSLVGISSGDKSIARYIGFLQRRSASGLGFGLGGERMVAPTATGTSSSYDNTNIWLQAGWVPSARFGVQAQLVSANPDRKAFIGATDTLELATSGKRTDLEVRAFWRSRAAETGFRADALFGRTHWNGSGVTDQLRQGGIVVGWRTPTFGLTAQAFNRSRLTPWDLRASAGWTPVSAATAEAEVGYQTHDAGRTSRWIGVRGSLSLPLGFEVQGTLRQGSLVAAPALLNGGAQSLTDWQGLVRWQRRWATLEVGYAHTDPYRPLTFRSFTPSVPALAPAPATDWVTVGWRLALKPWLTLAGWYSDPTGRATPDGMPATHSLTTATIRSKFWRTFRSGIFDFKAQLAYETWGDGTIGRDTLGVAIPLDGASFWRTEIEIRLDSFLLYWDRYNLQASRKTYVPGFRILNFGSTFGVKWEFTN
jgi:hypothetical protein